MTGKLQGKYLDKGESGRKIVPDLKFNTMKQPELGKRISELRKGKGLTQEELVEKCNISVRTIQRIENGEVMPRSYTIKTILAALDYDLNMIPEENAPLLDKMVTGIKRFFLLDIDTSLSSDFLVKHLNMAWIWGLLFFMAGFLESAAEYFRYQEDRILFGNYFYIPVKIIVLVSYFFFQRGFILLGNLFHNYLLKIISLLLICGNTFVVLYDIASAFYWPVERDFMLGAEALTFGGIGIIYGISLNKLAKPVGRVATWAGVFEIIAACFFLTIIFGFAGFIILIPAELFEIIILYKACELVKTKQSNLSLT
ncbi:MAG TPA: helix-turn-helix transcriptional regulator [Bacteroidales bacterium]|jgi:transcriptional regulator with XRE-family HTH domain|nr:helix-turn-helix transcriptional regulator [Bacteroidales bacterium]